MKKTLFFLALFLFSSSQVFSQEEKAKAFQLNGYVTNMQSAMFDSLSDPVTFDNLIHNRLNFSVRLNNNITFETDLRNRLFAGDMAATGTLYSDMIGRDQGFADLSWNLIKKNSFFFNTTVDRVWLDLNYTKFQARIGRQRINWGQALVWNPNDIFNAYSFFDFDYVERPGSDAVRLQYYPAPSSAAELAFKLDNDNDLTAAGLFRFSKWNYDIQFLAGFVNGEDIVTGAGWSGPIGSISFRGEFSWFQPYGEWPLGSGTLIATTGFDKVLKNGSMAQVQLMYCNDPLKLNTWNSIYSGNLSAKELAFSKFTAFGQYTWAVTPLLNITASAMWFPDIDGYFAGPSVDYSLSENLDFSLLWQHFTMENGAWKTRINLAFLRIKYSF